MLKVKNAKMLKVKKTKMLKVILKWVQNNQLQVLPGKVISPSHFNRAKMEYFADVELQGAT
jgi:hypothetical protein